MAANDSVSPCLTLLVSSLRRKEKLVGYHNNKSRVFGHDIVLLFFTKLPVCNLQKSALSFKPYPETFHIKLSAKIY